MFFSKKDNPVSRMQERCYAMGYATKDFIEHEELMQKLVKVIVQEKVMDEEAFELAKQAFAEGCNDKNLGDLNNDPKFDNVVPS